MSTKKSAKPKTKTRAKSKPNRSAAKTTAPDTGDHARMTISAAALKDLAKVFDQCKDRAAVANGALGAATKGYVEKGLNPVAFNLVNRVRRQAQRDPLKARVTWEDVLDYFDKLQIEDMLASNMFAEQEGRTTKRDRKKKNGKGEQLDLSERENVITGTPQELGHGNKAIRGGEIVDVTEATGEPEVVH